jgi:hypothetical protein
VTRKDPSGSGVWAARARVRRAWWSVPLQCHRCGVSRPSGPGVTDCGAGISCGGLAGRSRAAGHGCRSPVARVTLGLVARSPPDCATGVVWPPRSVHCTLATEQAARTGACTSLLPSVHVPVLQLHMHTLKSHRLNFSNSISIRVSNAP